MIIKHPYYDLVEDPRRIDDKAVVGLTVNAALESGIDAKVIMLGRPKVELLDLFNPLGGALNVAPRPVQFYVVVRELRPGPRLAPRDEQAMMWLRANGWETAVAAAEARWLELFQSGELEAHAARVADARQVEAERRRLEDANAPGFWDEVISSSGDRLQGLYDAARDAIGTIGTVVKWGVGLWLGAKVIKAVRR